MNPGSDPLLSFRCEFPILEATTYLVSHSLGAMPRGAEEGLRQYAASWGERGVRAWNEGWWSLPVTLGDEVAALLGAPSGSISMQPNVTLATAVFLSALRFPPDRRRIVTTALEFPSLLYLLEGCSDEGTEVVRVPSDDGETIDRERLLSAIDAETRLVVLSHVLFRSSFIQDVPAVVRRAREVGAQVLLDVYQSAGTLPLDLTSLDVDAAVGGCLKWLCGGPGVAFLYVRPALAAELEPRLTGWQSHADPFAFETAPLRRAGGAWRFLHGTPAVPALFAARAGLQLISAAGLNAIRAKSLRQTGILLDRCRHEGWPVRTPLLPEHRGGTVSIDPPHAYEVSRELLAREILIDYRPGAGIRIAPHFYTTDDELRNALDTLAGILADGSYRRHEALPRDVVT